MSVEKYLSDEGIKSFLDAVDMVLNSNTFLLYIPEANLQMPTFQWQNHVRAYIGSDSFDQDLVQQDILRKWNNFTRSKSTSKCFKRKNEVQLKTSFIPLPYLEAMLTDERVIEIPETQSIFYSPYNKGIETKQAKNLVKNFINALFGESFWQLWTVNPDFLYSKGDIRKLGQPVNFLAYFMGSDCLATDSASLLINDQKAFLLLTNGVD
ncbi:hypothetical protein AD998_14820 [bacterium 336/3]|nr:hypothetical protein AD998_14820 [bacterium 336/3]